MSYQPQDPQEHQDIIDLINQVADDNKECCDNLTKYMYGISYQLNQQQIILRELLKCCRYVPIRPNTGVIIPGQAIVEITPRQDISNTRPQQPLPPVYKSEPKGISYTDTPLRFYPVDKGYFPIIGIPGSWYVSVDRRIMDKAGNDLSTKLPIYFNQVVCEDKTIGRYSSPVVQKKIYQYKKCIELVAIRGYVIKDTSQGKDTPLLIYETRDLSTGSVRTFEGPIYLWKRYTY